MYKWFAKPEGLSSIDCARLGWINTGVDTLKCKACSEIFVCKVSPDLDIEAGMLVWSCVDVYIIMVLCCGCECMCFLAACVCLLTCVFYCLH